MKAITWFVLISTALTACTAAGTPTSISIPISTSTATLVIKPPNLSPIPTFTSSPSPTDTQTPTTIPTISPTAEPTSTEEPTLTPEPTPDPRDVLIEQALAQGIGPDWESFIEFNEEHSFYQITMISEGEYLDYTDDPTEVPISINSDENPEILVGTKAYYLDIEGKKQEVILPLVMRLADDRIYRLGPYRENIVNWPLEEIVSNLPTVEDQSAINGHVGGLRGEVFWVFYVPSENVESYYRSFGMNPPGDPYNIFDKLNRLYQENHAEELEGFVSSGKPPSSGIFFPSTQMGMTADEGTLWLP